MVQQARKAGLELDAPTLAERIEQPGFDDEPILIGDFMEAMSMINIWGPFVVYAVVSVLLNYSPPPQEDDAAVKHAYRIAVATKAPRFVCTKIAQTAIADHRSIAKA